MRDRVEKVYGALETVAQFGIPPAGAVSLIDVGHQRYLDFFEQEVLTNLVEKGGATCRFYEGAYGAGKTHLLELLSELAMRRGMVVARADLSQALSLTDWHQITKFVLENMECEVSGRLVRGLPDILTALAENRHIEIPDATVPHAGFLHAMQYCTKPRDAVGNYEVLRRFLRGEKVNAASIAKAGLIGVKQPLSKRNSEKVLKTVLAGLFHAGLPGTVLLFDETENTLNFNRSKPARKHVEAANLMRRLIDGCSNELLVGTVAVFAVLPGFLQNCDRIYPALGQRLRVASADLDAPPAWRQPVLQIPCLSSMSTHETFLCGAVDHIMELLRECGDSAEGLDDELLKAGDEVLQLNAGSGFRRNLMKRLSTQAILRLNRGEGPSIEC